LLAKKHILANLLSAKVVYLWRKIKTTSKPNVKSGLHITAYGCALA